MVSPEMLKKRRQALEGLCRRLPARSRIDKDPIEIPHRYKDPGEIEIAGLIAAVLAYGRVDLFKACVDRILALADGGLYAYLKNFNARRERPRFEGIYYRFNTAQDLFDLMALMSRVVKKYGTIGTLFQQFYASNDDDIGPTLSRFVARLRDMLESHPSRGLSYLLPSPASGSACKRLNLFLRWMIRANDGVDFGLWKTIPPAKLIIPLDTHIIRISQYLHFTSRKTPDWKMAREITAALRACDSLDPLRYDFSLCHLGISGACPLTPALATCGICVLQDVCAQGRALIR